MLRCVAVAGCHISNVAPRAGGLTAANTLLAPG